MKKLTLLSIIAVFTVAFGWAQSPTNSYTYFIGNVGHNTADLDGETYNSTNDTLWYFAEVAPTGTSNFTTATDTFAAVGTLFDPVNGLTMNGLPPSTTLDAQLRSFVTDTMGNPTMDIVYNSVTFTTLAAPQIGVVDYTALDVATINTLDINLGYTCGNVMTDYFVEYGDSPGNYTNQFTVQDLSNSGDTLLSVVGLNSGTTYYFRITPLDNGLGAGQPDTESFTTLSEVDPSLSNLMTAQGSNPSEHEASVDVDLGTSQSEDLMWNLLDSTGTLVQQLGPMTITSSGQYDTTFTGLPYPGGFDYTVQAIMGGDTLSENFVSEQYEHWISITSFDTNLGSVSEALAIVGMNTGDCAPITVDRELYIDGVLSSQVFSTVTFNTTTNGQLQDTLVGLMSGSTCDYVLTISSPCTTEVVTHSFTALVWDSVTVDVNVDPLAFEPDSGSANINFTIGDCGPITIHPILYNNGFGVVEDFGASGHNADGNRSLMLTGLQSSSQYHLVTETSTQCGTMMDTTSFTSEQWSQMAITWVDVTTPTPDQMQAVVMFDPGDYNAGLISAELFTDLWNTQQSWPASYYNGPSSDVFSTANNLQPTVTYYFVVTYTDTLGVVQDQDTTEIVMPNIPYASGAFQNVAGNQAWINFDFFMDPGSTFNGSAVTGHYELIKVSNSLVERQGSVGPQSSPGANSRTLDNLAGGVAYTLMGYVENAAGQVQLISIPVSTADATHPSVAIDGFTEAPGNMVQVEISVDGHGNASPILEVDLRVNGSLVNGSDHQVGPGDTVIVPPAYGPFSDCDEIQVQAAVITGQFGGTTAQGNLVETITINCPNSITESDAWEGLIVTGEVIKLPSNMKQAELRVFNTAGQLVENQIISGSLTFSPQRSGMYMYHFTTEDGKYVVRKVMKR